MQYTPQHGDYRLLSSGNISFFDGNWTTGFTAGNLEQAKEYLEFRGCMIVHRDEHATYWRRIDQAMPILAQRILEITKGAQ